MLMRAVADFNVFDIGILEIVFFVCFFLFLFFAFQRVSQVLICSVAIHRYHRHNFSIRLSAYEFCMPASLVFNFTKRQIHNWPLYSTSSP